VKDVRTYGRRPVFALARWAWRRGWIEANYKWYCWHNTRPLGRPFAWLANRAGDWPVRKR